jgi:peptide/nickel transport system substrate-binding protein
VDAAAVKANFDTAPKLGPRATLALGYLTGYVGTKVVDARTAEVSFEHPNAQFLQASSTFTLGLVSASTIAKTPDQRCTEGVIGSGPFTLDKYVPNQSISLKKRTGYAWGSSLWKKQGEAYLDGLTFKIVPESGVRVGSLQSGQVDAISSVGPQDETALDGGKTRLQARSNPGVVFNLGVNNSRPLVAERPVREAILKAINRQEVIDTVLTKETKPATSILASTTPLYTDLSGKLGFDAEAAKNTLQAAGWVPGADGIRAKNGQRLSLQVAWFANLATNKSALELIQQQLKLVGIDLVLKEYPIAKVAEIQAAGDYDLSWGNVTRADPDITRGLYSTKLANFNRIPAGPLDQLLTEQAATSDPATRAGLVKQVQENIVDNAYAIPVVELTTVLGISEKVHDLAFEASSRLQFHDTWKSQ